jgi:signal transduction histidine kinase
MARSDQAGNNSPTFSVDTHLFTELGELLVGRDSTALVELIKNAYDADARHVTVLAQQISDQGRGFIRVVDDGIGMTRQEFIQGFLRIAGQSKQGTDRRSRLLRRRYTGAKGIGRLAAHKLAHRLEVDSIARGVGSASAREKLSAVINWDAIEELPTLDEVQGSGAIRIQTSAAADNSPTGTSIGLRQLRRGWSPQERDLFLTELQTFEPPLVLQHPLSKSIVSEPVLFLRPTIRDAVRKGAEFNIALEGDFAVGEDYWQQLAEQCSWILEIDAKKGSDEILFGISPTNAARQETRGMRKQLIRVKHPDPGHGPFFQCRVLCKEGAWPKSLRETNLIRRAYGIRVFMEGFRVLPYGEPGNDWLGLDEHYSERGRSLPELDIFGDRARIDQEGLTSLPNSNYFGAVFLIQEAAPTLRTLVNREGFVPDEALTRLTQLVRIGVDLLTRTRARFSAAKRAKRRRQRLGAGRSSLGAALSESVETAASLASEAKTLLAGGNPEAAGPKVLAAVNEVQSIGRLAREIIGQAEMIRVLASVGTQLAAFIHEVQGLLGISATAEAALQHIADEPSTPMTVKIQVGRVIRSLAELRQRLERQSAYLVEVSSADARRRRIRMSYRIRFDTSARYLAVEASKRGVSIDNNIPEELTTPLMFPAETTAIFTNLLSNAIKAAGEGGRVEAGGKKTPDGGVTVRLENTGVAVNLATSEDWFAPYTSTSQNVNPSLGQGMGLGLPITRAILAEYGATISFVRPHSGFATAVQILWPRDS